MLRATLLLTLCLAPVRVQSARAETPDPAAFLALAREEHADLRAQGLASFSAQARLRRSEADSLRNYKDLAGFGYAWSAPDAESFDFAATHESLHKPLRDAIRGLHREVTGGLWFDFLGTLTDCKVTEDETCFVLAGTAESVGPVRATFGKTDRALASVEFTRARITFTYGYLPTPDGLRVAWREVVAGDAAAVRTTYRVVRKVSGFSLPTVLDLLSAKNTTEFALDYQRVNDEPARREDPSADEMQRRVKAFEKAWRSWGDGQRLLEIQALAELPDDRASTAIARLGLKDANPFVRREAAEALGIMGRTNAVPPLLAALEKNGDHFEAYLAVIRALGEIGDARAVDALSRHWWNQKIRENGVLAARSKISALGRIRHVTAVDALIETFFMARQDTISQLRADLVHALGKLTGQDFGNEPRRWQAWWKENRRRFTFD